MFISLIIKCSHLNKFFNKVGESEKYGKARMNFSEKEEIGLFSGDLKKLFRVQTDIKLAMHIAIW